MRTFCFTSYCACSALLCLTALAQQFNISTYAGGGPPSAAIVKGSWISSVAIDSSGHGKYTYLGDGGPALDASLIGAVGMTMDSAGNIYLADSNAGAVRRLEPVVQSDLK